MIQPPLFTGNIAFTNPGIDIACRCFMGIGAHAHMMGEGTATAGAAGHHDLDAMTGKQADGGFVNGRIERLLRAAIEQGNTHMGAPLGLVNLRSVNW